MNIPEELQIPEELLDRLPLLHIQQQITDPIVYLRFYFPAPGGCQWYAYEGERLSQDDILFFRLLVDGFEQQRAYFTLQELAHTTGPTPDTQERVVYDPTFTPMALSEVRRLSLAPKQKETPDM